MTAAIMEQVAANVATYTALLMALMSRFGSEPRTGQNLQARTGPLTSPNVRSAIARKGQFLVL